jgi:uncharacterized protein with HEPN domain
MYRLEIILEMCSDIEKIMNRFGKDYDTYLEDIAYYHSVNKCLEEIGESSGKFSTEFKERYADMVDWRQIKLIRNLFAHAYAEMNDNKTWQTLTYFLPIYKNFCENAFYELKKETNE